MSTLPGARVFVLATANSDKALELRRLLVGPWELRARPARLAPVVEDAGSLVGNARLKAQAVASATGCPAIADDTGLFVDALGGAPGVEAAYFAGPHATYADNVARLLDALAGVEDRRASFRTVALVRWPDGRECYVEGRVEGSIAHAAGGTHGFGYDPVFVPEGSDRTFAEMSPAEKDHYSHRGRAFRGLTHLLLVAEGSLPDCRAGEASRSVSADGDDGRPD